MTKCGICSKPADRFSVFSDADGSQVGFPCGRCSEHAEMSSPGRVFVSSAPLGGEVSGSVAPMRLDPVVVARAASAVEAHAQNQRAQEQAAAYRGISDHLVRRGPDQVLFCSPPPSAIREAGNSVAAEKLDWARQLAEANQRANRLADECGRLKDENRELLVENAQLRRQVERGKR